MMRVMSVSVDDLGGRFPRLKQRLGPEAFAAFASALERRRVSGGEVILRWGQPNDTMHVVEDGVLEVSLGDGAARRVLAEARAGEAVGEVGMLEPGPASATVTARGDATLLGMSHAAFERFGAEKPDAAGAVLHALAMDLVERLRASGAGLGGSVTHAARLEEQARSNTVGWLGRLAKLAIGWEAGS
jgi:CRP-like cAMP-binding protein